MKSYEQQLWEHTMLAINRILTPEAHRRQKDNTPSLGQLLTEALGSINSNPAPSLESPTHGCDTARETCGTGVTTSADVAAEICEDCHGTGERFRKDDDAPMSCWCEAGDDQREKLS